MSAGNRILPWYEWRWHDWKNSPRVMALSTVAKHCYRSLLDSQWANGNRIPNMPAILWKYADAASPEEFETVRAEVMQFFDEVDGGKSLANETLSGIWEGSRLRMDERSEKASRAAKKKWEMLQASPEHCASTAQAMQQDTTRQDKKEHKGIDAAKSAAVERVFAYYQKKTNRNPKTYAFTGKRKQKGLARLDEFQKSCDGDLEQATAMMKRAVDGICADTWEDRHKFRDWEQHLFGNTESAEKWATAPLARVNGKAYLPVTNDVADAELRRQGVIA